MWLYMGRVCRNIEKCLAIVKSSFHIVFQVIALPQIPQVISNPCNGTLFGLERLTLYVVLHSLIRAFPAQCIFFLGFGNI